MPVEVVVTGYEIIECINCDINHFSTDDICTSEGTVDLNQYNGDYVGVWSSTVAINNNVIDRWSSCRLSVT
ncbi:MAG: hypothetical protein R2766_10165 [Saprospiraceae bacterium]